MANFTLESLHIGGNDIGDDGIAAIAEVLNETKISKLFASKCGIGCSGAKSLAVALLNNENMKLLVLEGNPLTVEGARLLLQSAMNNEVCQVIKVDKEYKSDDEVKKMIAFLKKRKRQQVAIASYVATQLVVV